MKCFEWEESCSHNWAFRNVIDSVMSNRRPRQDVTPSEFSLSNARHRMGLRQMGGERKVPLRIISAGVETMNWTGSVSLISVV